MAVATDTLGRVMLLDVASMAVVRLWKVLLMDLLPIPHWALSSKTTACQAHHAAGWYLASRACGSVSGIRSPQGLGA